MQKLLTKNKFIFSVIITAVFTLLLLLISGFQVVYSTNDDYLISWLIFNGEEKSFFINYFLQTFLVILQSLLPFVNCFSLFQLIGCFTALISINYVILSQRKGSLSIVLSLLTSVLVCSTSVVVIQWTHTTTLMSIAGFVLLIYSLQNEKRKKYRIFQIMFSSILVVTGSLLRFVAFEICTIFVVIYMLLILIENIIKTKNSFLKRIWASIKVKKSLILTVIIVISFALNIISTVIVNSDNSFIEHQAFNNARAQVTDYSVKNYEGNEEFYNNIDINSKEELDLALIWHIDKNFFDTEKFTAISEYANNSQDIIANLKYAMIKSVQKIYKVFVDVKTTLNLPINNMVFITIIGLLCILFAIIWYSLYKKLEKDNTTKLTIFLRITAILISIATWNLFVFAFGLNSNSIFTFIVFGLTVVSAIISSRYNFMLSFCLNLFSIALYIYQSYSRISFRVSFTIFIPAIVLIVYAILSTHIEKKDANNLLITNTVVTIVLVVTVLCSCINIWMYNVIPNICTYDTELNGYIKQNSNEFFFHINKEYAKIDKAYTKPLQPLSYPDNTIPYGGWQTASECYENMLKDHSVECIFFEMIDSDNRRFILSEADGYDIVNIYENHYNSHYASEHKTISLVREKELSVVKTTWFNDNETENIGIYKVVTK